jgi:hypothetical protein
MNAGRTQVDQTRAALARTARSRGAFAARPNRGCDWFSCIDESSAQDSSMASAWAFDSKCALIQRF